MVNVNQPIDYSTSEGIKMFAKATSSLYSDDKEAFDCSSEGLLDFIGLVKDRATMVAYNDIFRIPDNSVNPPVTRDFLSNYGALSYDDIKANVASYIASQSRKAQESFQLYHALMNSLSAAGRAKVSVWEDDYTVQGIKSGVLLLKKIIQISMIDTNATASHIRTQLASLDTYIGTIDSDISKFNQHVKSLVNQLHMRRETTTDLLTNLFKGYLAASDKQFVEYIKKKKDEYEEGSEIPTDRLMTLAENKFKILVQNQEWKAPSPEEAQILALKAELESMKRNRGKKDNKVNKDKKANNKAKKNGKKEGKPAWMSKPPLANEPKDKKVDGKEYHWCPRHLAWTRHKPSECRLVVANHANEQAPGQNKGGNKRENLDTKGDKRVKLAQSLSAIAQQAEQEEE